jgi:hypothetical protein
MEQRLELVNHDLGYDFASKIGEANGCELCNSRGVVYLWNESNMGVVKFI